MIRVLVPLLLVGCVTTAPAPTHPAKSYDNVFTVGDVSHDYRLRWAPGTHVRVKVAAGGAVLLLANTGGSWQHAESHASPELVLEVGEQPVTVRVRASGDDGQLESGRYSLEFEPGPEAEVARFDRDLEAGMAIRAKQVASMNAELRKREALTTGRADIETRKASLCPRSNAIYATIQQQETLAYRFCDGSVVRVRNGKASLGRALGGADYEDFVARERAALQVAEHNARVLRTPEWGQREGQARAAFEARVRLFVARFRKPENWYFAEAKRSNVPVLSE